MIRTTFPVLFLLIIVGRDLLGQGPPRRKPYDSKCGSEIQWVDDFDAAATKAAETGKPVFWYVPTAHGTRMDRRQELYWYVMGGAFMDQDLIDLVNAQFVPLRFGFSPLLRRSRSGPRWGEGKSRQEMAQLAEKYNCKLPRFIEPGIMLLDSKMELLHSMDRLTTYNSDWMLNRIRQVAAKHKALSGVGAWQPRKRAGKILEGHSLLSAGRISQARDAFDAVRSGNPKKGDGPQATYFAGVCRHMLGQTSKADDLWRTLAKTDSRWGWKARLELERWGPFIRGFETYINYPERATTTDLLTDTRLPSGEKNLEEMTHRAVDVILNLQRETGGWDDSTYDFGGVDGLPNVHCAVTALCAQALLEWRSVAPKRIDVALEKARKFLFSEKSTNPRDDDEYVWAHVYRLHYMARLAREQTSRNDSAGRSRTQKKISEIVRIIERTQKDSGAWAHEYPNPFVTASVLHALAIAETAGVKVRKKLTSSGSDALEKCRSETGTYSYGMRQRSGRPAAVQGSAGRMPLCELALMLSGKSDNKKLGTALQASFDNHSHLEAIRKYDDHSDQYGNGGFFFWYDMLGRTHAIKAYKGPERNTWLKQMRQIVLDIHEVDGGWIDSHELGKSYGTAMGLIVLKETMDVIQQ